MRGSSAIHGALDFGIYLSGLSTADDGSVISNVVQYEVKSARAAGTSKLTLEIQDDEHDRAVCAKYSIGTTDDDVAEINNDILTDVVAEIGDSKLRGEILTTKDIAKAVRRSVSAMDDQMSAMESAGFVSRHKLPGGVSRGWELTTMGQGLYRQLRAAR